MGGGARTFDEDEEEEPADDGRQKVELREDSISLDQVRDYSVYSVKIMMGTDDRASTPAGEANCNAERMEKCAVLKIF